MTEISGDSQCPKLLLTEIVNTELDISGAVRAVSLMDQETVCLLTDEGKVWRVHRNSLNCELLFNTAPPKGVRYSDGGFDAAAPSSIYTMDDIIVIVNDYKQNGFVLNLKENYHLRLCREDYHAEFSKYPIALYQNAEGVPHLIFSTAWNRLEIVNLTTRQVLTADKSLIEEGAEERHLAFYKEHEESNKLLWPGEFDYFFGRLILSPNRKKFLSAGWVWGSFEFHTLYDVEDFITNRRIRYDRIFQGEHLGRSACFVDDNTIAVPYHEELDGGGEEDGAPNGTGWSILLCDLKGREAGRITLKENWNLGAAGLSYNPAANCFYLFSNDIGLAAVSADGSIRLHEPDIKPNCYDEKYRCFIIFNKNRIKIYQIK